MTASTQPAIETLREACEGWPTPNPYTDALSAVEADLRRKDDALRNLIRWAEGTLGDDYGEIWWEQAREAISSVCPSEPGTQQADQDSDHRPGGKERPSPSEMGAAASDGHTAAPAEQQAEDVPS